MQGLFVYLLATASPASRTAIGLMLWADGVSGLGFALSPKVLENWTKSMKQWFSNIGQQMAQDSDP